MPKQATSTLLSQPADLLPSSSPFLLSATAMPILATAAISCHVRLSICEGRIIVPTRKEVDGSALNAPNDRKKNLYAFLSEIKWLVCSHIPCHVSLKRKCIMLWSSKNSHCMSYRFANTCVQCAVESKKCARSKYTEVQVLPSKPTSERQSEESDFTVCYVQCALCKCVQRERGPWWIQMTWHMGDHLCLAGPVLHWDKI